jgi:hypothetical protein
MLATLTGASLPDPLADEQAPAPGSDGPDGEAAAEPAGPEGSAESADETPTVASPPSNVVASEADHKPAQDKPAPKPGQQQPPGKR